MSLRAPKNIQTGSESIVIADGVTIDITLPEAVVIANSIVMMTIRCNDNQTRFNRHIFTSELTSTTNLQLVRTEATFASDIVVEWTVIEFEEGDVTIQRITNTATTTSEDLTINAVPLSQTIAILSQRQSHIGIDEQTQVIGQFTSPTNFRETFVATPTDASLVTAWQIVTFNSTDVRVQSGVISLGAAGDPEGEQKSNTATIQPVSVPNTFIIGAGANNTSAQNSNNRSFASLDLIDSTTVKATRSTAGTTTRLLAAYFVVELHGGQRTEKFQATLADASTTPTTQPTWRSDLSVDNTAIMNGSFYPCFEGDDAVDNLPLDRPAITTVLNADAKGVTIQREGVDGTATVIGWAVDWTPVPAPETKLSSAIIRKPWTEQPPTGTKVNVSKPITNGLLGAWVPDIGTQTFFDALNKGRPLVPGGGANAPSISTGRFGSTYKSNSDATTGTSGDHRRFYLSEGATTENGLVLGNYDAVTVMALIRPQASAGTWGRVLAQATGGDGAGGVELTYRTFTTPHLQAYINATSTNAGNPLQAWPYDELKMATYVIFPGQDTTDPNPKFYKGRSIAADQNSNDWTAATGNTPFCIGNWNRSDTTTSRHYNGEIYCVYLWNRELSDNERLSLVENPWQIFEPQKIMIPNTDPLQLEVY